MKKSVTPPGRKKSSAKHPAKAGRPESKRKAKALKATQDARIREVTTKQVRKSSKPLSPARTTSVTLAKKTSVTLAKKKGRVRNSASTRGDEKPTVQLVDDQAWAAELKLAPSLAPSIEPAGLTESDNRAAAVKSEILPRSGDHTPSSETDLQPSALSGMPLPMEIALAHWKFCTNSMFAMQQICVHFTSRTAAWPRPTLKP